MNIKNTLEDNYALVWREFLELQIKRSVMQLSYLVVLIHT